MAIRHWPEQERPREKLLAQGANFLSDAELLAVFLRTGTVGRSAVELARDLLNKFGGLRGILNADQKSFCCIKGLGKTKFAQLQACLELAQRYLSEQLRRGDVLCNPQLTRNYIKTQLRDRQHEVFACLFLDAANRMISFEELFFGSVNITAVHPRQIIKRALFHNAVAVIVAHNHPSGTNQPSLADQQLTVQLKNALALIDVHLLDHFIIGDGPAYSMAEMGMLD